MKQTEAGFLMQYFAYEHLPENLRLISKPFCEMANECVSALPDNSEKDACMRKLLEAKDCAVRAALARSF